MSKEILLVVDAVSNEKDVDRDIIFGAIEAALATATRKKNRGDIDVRVDIDRHDGSYRTYRRWEVMGDTDEEGNPLNGLEFPSRQVTLDAARPPCCRIKFWISSRVKRASVPVTTSVLSANTIDRTSIGTALRHTSSPRPPFPPPLFGIGAAYSE